MTLHDYTLLVLLLFSVQLKMKSTMAGTSKADSGGGSSTDEDGDGNETEITLLVNSTFMIIEELEINATEMEKAHSKAVDKRGGFRKLGSKCRSFSISEKYGMLESVGGRNQLYMAETPDEASRGFVIPSTAPKAKALADNVEENASGPYCNEECETIRIKLQEALKQRRRPKTPLRSMPKAMKPIHDAGPVEVDEGNNVNRGCYLETFVPIGNCTEPGDEVSWAHEQLCSMCRGIYMLGENCFPTFFNSVLCNQQETGCIFDSFSDRAHGLCRSETLSLRVLRNRGDAKCEDWVIEQLELPVACQCLLSKGSWLRSHPPKEL